MVGARSDEHPVAHRDRLLREGAAAWERLRALLDAARDRESLHAEGASRWRAADVYAHFARYQARSIEQIHRALAGAEPLSRDGLDDDTRNERWVAEDRALSFEEARAWCLATTGALRALLMSLTPEQWAASGTWWGDDVLPPHYESRARYVETGGREGG